MKGRKPDLRAIEGSGMARARHAPGWMSLAAKAEWRRIMPALTKRRLLTETDLAQLESYCVAVGMAREAEAEIARDGIVIDAPQGKKRHPAVGVMHASMAEARRIAAEFGLTPVSRARLKTEEEDDDDRWTGLVAG